MEAFDNQTAARVWQRVQSRDSLGQLLTRPEDPVALVLQSHALAGLYLGLRRNLKGKAGERCTGLYRSQKRTANCLRGLCRLTGAAPGLPPMEAGTGTPEDRLRSCAHREQRLSGELARLAAEGEYAQVYAQLSRQAGERCRTVLEILGELEK